MTSALPSNYGENQGGYDELRDTTGAIRPHWRALFHGLGALSDAQRLQAIQHSRRLVLENDVSYHAPGAGTSRPWTLDILPFMLAEQEYSELHAGLAQRTRLLEAVIADCLGPQNLLRDGHLPPAILFGQNVFFPACHGTKPPGGQHIYLAGYDLARAPNGQWWVVRNRTSMPSGLGYALEARIIASSCLQRPFEDGAVSRVSGFFRTMRDALHALVGRDNPLNLVLTSQQHANDYFEHAFLGRYLGQGVVSGGDLTVRDDRLYLKTVRGLQSVDLLVRRIETAQCDPLELISESVDGVPGLMQVLRAGHLNVVNWPGAEIADNPALSSFLPKLCELLLGEPLLLPSAASWWCGQAKEKQYVLDNLENLIVRRIGSWSPLHSGSEPGEMKNQFVGRQLTGGQLDDLAEKIRHFPEQFVGRESIQVSYAPAWNTSGDLVAAATSLRLYVTKSEENYSLMPGGIARADTNQTDLGKSIQRLPNELNKDIWVSGSNRHLQASVPSLLQSTISLRRSDNNLASRTADNLFWLGSYMERAEGATRLFKTLIQHVSGEYSMDRQVAALDRLAAVLVANRHLSARRARRLVAQGKPSFAYGLSQISFDPESADNLHQLLANIARIADLVRERLSPDMWRLLERVTQMPSQWRQNQTQDPIIALSSLNAMADGMAAINGMMALNMTRADGWRFLDIGRRLERIRQTARLFRELMGQADHTEQGSMSLLLELADCAITYRTRYAGTPQFFPVSDLVLVDDTQPRSMLTQVVAIRALIRQLPPVEEHQIHGPGQRNLIRLESSLRLLDAGDLDGKRRANGQRTSVIRLTEQAEQDADEVTAQLTAAYFSHATRSRVSGQSGAS